MLVVRLQTYLPFLGGNFIRVALVSANHHGRWVNLLLLGYNLGLLLDLRCYFFRFLLLLRKPEIIFVIDHLGWRFWLVDFKTDYFFGFFFRN